MLFDVFIDVLVGAESDRAVSELLDACNGIVMKGKHGV